MPDNADGCTIKGNISSSGERIYHIPGGKWYDRAKVSPEKGERWFFTEAEAVAAGWRRVVAVINEMLRTRPGDDDAIQ